MSSKFFLLSLLAVGLLFATAPEWLQVGSSAKYALTSGANKVELTYTVSQIDSSTITIKSQGTMDGKTQTKTEKIDLNSNIGSFWIDKKIFAGAKVGTVIKDPSAEIKELRVIEINSKSFVGKTWNTITFEQTLIGAPYSKTTAIVDADSGLLLQATGVGAITEIKDYNILNLHDSNNKDQPSTVLPPSQADTEPKNNQTKGGGTSSSSCFPFFVFLSLGTICGFFSLRRS